MNKAWLHERSREELITIVMQLTNEIYTKITSKMTGVPDQLKHLDFVPVKIQSVSHFTRLPKNAETALVEDTKRVILVIPDSHKQPIGIEIIRSVVLGRGPESENVDLDLTDYDAGPLGVSRRHAILQILAGQLYIVDSGSTNGTYINGRKLGHGEPNIIENDDIVSLGGFHIKVIIVRE